MRAIAETVFAPAATKMGPEKVALVVSAIMKAE